MTLNFAATRHVLWALNTPEMRLRPGLGRKRILGVFRAHGTRLGGFKIMYFLLLLNKV